MSFPILAGLAEAVYCLLLSLALLVLLRRYERVYIRRWVVGLAALGMFYGLQALSFLVTTYPQVHPFRLSWSLGYITAGYVGSAWIVVGMFELARHRTLSRSLMIRLTSTLVVATVIMVVATAYATPNLRYVLRVGLRSFLMGGAFLGMSAGLLRMGFARADPSRRFILFLFCLFGILQFHDTGVLVAWLSFDLGPPAYWRYRQILEFLSIALMSTGIILWLLTDEWARAAEVGEAKMKAVGQLTGGIAHHFNNLFTVILGNLQLLQDVTDDPRKVRELSASAAFAADRASELTHRLTAFSRIQLLQPQPVNLTRLLEDMHDLLTSRLGETVQVSIHIAENQWECEVDPGQLENVILDLAINCRDAMPKGGHVTIEASNVTLDEDYATDVEAGDYASIAVSDSGVGMSPEVIQNAFDPFYTTKEVGAGSGLGLSMVYGFAKQSRGHVSIHSEVGKGTSVQIYLPRTTSRVQQRSRPAALN